MSFCKITGKGMRDRFHFVGVSTAESSIMRLFPRWAELLGLAADIEGRDIPLDAPPDRCRAVVSEVAERPEVWGALVTTHKVSIYQNARDLFGRLDGYAEVCEEVSCLSKRDGVLVGHAKDPITAGRSIAEMIEPDHFADRGGHVLCMGAGGAGVAVTVSLLSLERPPERIVLTDVDGRRLAAAKRTHGRLGALTRVDYVEVGGRAEEGDRLVGALPPESLVVNATGMGKDRPGSPVTERARFPDRGVVWDLNYRGELRFVVQARAQQATRGLSIHDGWRYFLHGWAEHIAEGFGLDVTPGRFTALADAAEPFRPTASG